MGFLSFFLSIYFIYFPLAVMLLSETPKLPTDPASERVSWCLETSPL